MSLASRFSAGSQPALTRRGAEMTEKKTAWTPGPWGIEYDNADEYFAQWYDVGPAKIEFGRNDDGEAMANAHLIAAAPELYQALEWYETQFCEGFCSDFPTALFYTPEMDIDCSGCRARVALAKARGEPTCAG